LKAHTGQRTNKCLVKGPLDIQPLPGLLSKRFSDVFFPDWLGAAYKKNHVLFEAAKGCQVDPKWCFTSPLGHDEERVLAMLAGETWVCTHTFLLFAVFQFFWDQFSAVATYPKFLLALVSQHGINKQPSWSCELFGPLIMTSDLTWWPTNCRLQSVQCLEPNP